jgi:hypothetical protein
MEFEYSKYFIDSLFSLNIAIISIITIISSLIDYSKFIANKGHKKKAICGCIFALIIGGVLLSINISKLVHGGAALLFEKEEDKIQICGQIDHVEELGYWGVPKLRFDGGSGTQITIDGVLCRTIYDIPFDSGDHVIVEYLPNSGYILHIDEVLSE